MENRIIRFLLLFIIAIFYFVQPLLARSGNFTTREYAEKYIRITSEILAPVYGPLAEQIVQDFKLIEEKGTGIDLGSGPGDLIIELCRRTKNMHWINVDVNPYFFPHFIRTARSFGFEDRVSAIYADAQNLPFKDNYADIIVSRGSFHLWSDKAKAFSEIYRVLKPGGSAFIGRGFSGNLPPEVARRVRSDQNKKGSEPKYSIAGTASEFEQIIKTLGIKHYNIRTPKLNSGLNINYGIWIEINKPPVRKISIPKNETLQNFKREKNENIYVLEIIEVLKKLPRDIIREPGLESPGLELSKSTVSRPEMEKQGAKTVIEALKFIPGAWTESRGRKVKQFYSIRGQKYPYPEYAVDGALYREFHELPYFFSSADIERIEVLRSSSAMLSGLSGLSGLINIIPRTYTRPETSWEIEYGTFNTSRAHLAHGSSIGNMSYALGLDSPYTDGPAGKHAAEGITHFTSNMKWTPTEKLSIQSSLFHIYGKRELAQAEPPAAKKFQEALQRFDPVRTTSASIRAFYLFDERASTEVLLNYANRDNIFIADTDSSHESSRDWDFEWGLNIIQSFNVTETNIIRAGARYNRWKAPYGKRFYSGKKCDLETYSFALVDEHRFGPLWIDTGLRWQRTYLHDYGAFNINGISKAFENVDPVKNQWEAPLISASIGAAYQFTDNLSIHSNILSGSLEPRRGSLDVNMKEPDKEQRIKADLGFRFTENILGELTFTGFFTKQKNAIVLSGRTETLNGRIMELYENRDQDQKGIEVSARTQPFLGCIQSFFNITVMRSRAYDNGKMVRNKEIPEFIMGGGIYVSLSNFEFNILWKNISSYENDRFAAGKPPVPQPLGDFHSFDLTAVYSFGRSQLTKLYFTIYNLTDVKYSTVVGYPDRGRRFILGVRQTFR